MNLKKTWFSYVLWFAATGLSIYFSLMFMRNLCLHMEIDSLLTNGFMYSFPVVSVLIAFMLRKVLLLCKWKALPKGISYAIHALLFFALVGLFVILRFQTLSGIDSLEKIENSAVYQAALIGKTSGIILPDGVHNYLYSGLISGVLLFLGNKAIAIVYLQLFLQTLSFTCLCIIGHWLKKGILGYLPALVFAVSPTFYEALPEVTTANFSVCLCVIGMLFWFLLFQKHEKQIIDYLCCMLTGIIGGLLLVYHPVCIVYVIGTVFLLIGKKNISTWNKCGFVFTYMGVSAVVYAICAFLGITNIAYFVSCFVANSGNRLRGMQYGTIMVFVILTAFLWMYIVAFWVHTKNYVQIYIVPLWILAVMHFCGASYQDVKMQLMLMQLYMAFLCVEGIRHLLIPGAYKQMVETNKEETNSVVKTLKQIEEKEENSKKQLVFENGVPSVTQIIGGKDALAKLKDDEKVIDKTAPIENVLPMPKKHVPKVLDYAFEPESEQMHYDVEIENDEYDY